jgi:DNA-binding MarR family transcriptional regulator
MSGDLEGFATIPRAIQRDPDISVQEKCVYLALSSRANARLQCWPTIATIAKEASVSESTAKRALDSLRSRQLVSWTPDPNGKPGRTVNIYTLGAPVEGGSG